MGSFYIFFPISIIGNSVKGQQSSEANFLVLIWAKENKQNYILNSALASKMSQIKKMKALYYTY